MKQKTGRKLLSLAMALALIIGFMPGMDLTAYAEGIAAKIGETGYSTVQAAIDAAMDGQMVVLQKNVDENIVFDKSNATVTIDMQSRTIDGSKKKNSVIIITAGTLVLDGDGVVTGGNGEENGNGTEAGYRNGGGVLVYGGSFIMKSSTITGNTGRYGGGVAIAGGTFTMEGGSIESNNATVTGGGVCVWTETAAGFSSSSFIMRGGTIQRNSGSNAGVDVYSTFNMEGGTITGNDGSGVYVRKSSSDGSGTFQIGGASSITGNTKDSAANNVYLESNAKITVNNTLSNTTPIGVTMENPGVFTTGGIAKDCAANFTSDKATYTVQVEGNELKLAAPPVASVTSGGTTTEYADFSTAVTSWANGGTLTLLADVEPNSNINVSGTETLDLNGKTMTLYNAMIKMSGTSSLEIKDTGTGGKIIQNGTAGIIGGHWSQLTISGGTLQGTSTYDSAIVYNDNSNDAMNVTLSGGEMLCPYSDAFSIYGSGEINLVGGKITSTSTQTSMTTSSAVLPRNNFTGTVNWSGTEITTKMGCGIYVRDTKTTVNITGGTFTTDNTNNANGGGYAVSGNAQGAIKISGSPSLGGGGIYLLNDKKITVADSLSNTTPIGVAMQNPGVFTDSTNTSYNDASKFVSDNSAYVVGKNADGQLEAVPPVAKVGETEYSSFSDALTAWTDGTKLTLLADVTISTKISVSGGVTKTLDLNGKTLTLASSASEQRVIDVNGGTTVFTLQDSSGTNAGKLTGVNPGGSDNGWSGALYINSGATVNMYGGTITGNTTTNGAGVWIDGRGHRGNATFNMYGGVITGNTATTGGGVYVGCQLNEYAGTAHFNMYGGTITGNTATNGSNVYIDKGVMTMAGGTIEGGFSHSDYVTVSFDANDGTGTMSAQYVKKSTDTQIKANEYYGTDGAKTEPALSREGYTFGGWNTSADGTGTNYTAGTDNINISADTTLYAKWTANTVTVTFNANGGSTVASQTVASGSLVAKPDDPTKTGHTFYGWYKEADCTNAWNFDSDTVAGDTTLYAKWERVSYDISGNIRHEGVSGIANLILYRNGTEYKRGTASFTNGIGPYQFEGLEEGNYSLIISMYADNASFTLEVPIGDISKLAVK